MPAFGIDGAMERRHDTKIGDVDIRDVAGCTCLRLRQATRAATQIFDAHLGRAGLTVSQFGVLAQLYGVSVWRESIAIKDLAGLIGMDSTTMVRALKPLEKQGWLNSAPDDRDRRSRLVWLSEEGKGKLAEATPHWEAAQSELRTRIGGEARLALDGLLELASDRLRPLRQFP